MALPPSAGVPRSALLEVVVAFAAATRGRDGVTLVLAAHPDDGPDEAAAAAVVLRALGDHREVLDGAAPVVVRTGGVPADVAPEALLLDLDDDRPPRRGPRLEALHRWREATSRLVALTPVKDRAAWARSFEPTRGYHHLVVDNASQDGTPDLLAARGAEVVRHSAPVSRTASWARAVTEARARAGGRWTKWLFAGDELDPGSADALAAALDAAPHVGMVVAEYVIDDGVRRERWGTLPETALISPREALRLSAERGNWFGSPVGHLFSPAGLEVLEVGTSPYVADWHACLSVARELPTLYLKHVVGTFSGPSRQHWRSAGDSLHARVQELEVRLRSATDLGPEGLPLLRQVEREALSALAPPAGTPVGPPAHPPAGPVRQVRQDPVTTRPAAPGPSGHRPDRESAVVAVQQPRLSTDPRDFHGSVPLFARQAQLAYLPQLATQPHLAPGLGVVDGVLRSGGASLEVVTTPRELQRRADALVCFEGRPYLPDLAPPAAFTGLKAYHVMDFVFFAEDSARALRSGGADLLLGYARHDVHSPFFAELYRGFEGRVHAVPFGFGERFAVRTPFRDRVPRAVGLGAVNPVDDPLCPPGQLDDYVAFHRGARWTHAWRRRLAEEAGSLRDVLDSRFPVWPETKDGASDAPALLDAHQAFVNDVGLMAFPPVRTYEGVASGAVLVAPAHPVYDELGLQHGVNALFHRDQDVDDFRRTVRAALADQDALAAVAAAGTALVRERYSHAQVAAELREVILAVLALTPARQELAGV